jgi:hypothetical protein
MTTSTEEIQGIILFATSSADAWSTLQASFTSQTISRSMQIRGALQKCKKEDKKVPAYYNEVKALADSLMSIGQPLTTVEFTGYLMHGLDQDYDSLVQINCLSPCSYRSHVAEGYICLDARHRASHG